jgi:putative flippase GtrA
MFKINKILQLLPDNKYFHKNSLVKLFSNQKSRFILVGGYNFIFNYIIGLGLYKIVIMDLKKISLFYIFSVIHNYFTHKFFSFKRTKFCKYELFRAIMVYGLMYFFSTYLLLTMIRIGCSQLVAYHINLLITLIIFYILHCCFTFRVKF